MFSCWSKPKLFYSHSGANGTCEVFPAHQWYIKCKSQKQKWKQCCFTVQNQFNNSRYLYITIIQNTGILLKRSEGDFFK